jgi:hypothetical protein
MWGRRLPPGVLGVEPSFKDLRDQLLILLMVQIGARAVEMGRARRRDISGDPPVISLLGKGSKRRALQVPPPTMIVYRELTEKLSLMADRQQRHGERDRADELLEPGAPLAPAISYWGINAGISSEQGLSRPGIAQMLRRRAVMAGIAPKQAEFARIHPHGMRHLFAKMSADSGTPMNRIQAMLGHSSVATTGIYMEERDPSKLISEAFRPAEPEPTRPAAPSPEGAPARRRSWDPERQAITPPRMRQRDIKPAKVIREPALGEEPGPVLREPEILEMPAEAAMAPPAPAVAPRVRAIERAREVPASRREERELEACEGLDNEALRRLCEIYQLHWGERGDRQPLIKGKDVGRKAGRLAANRELEEEDEITPEEILAMSWDEMQEIAEASEIDVSDLSPDEENDIEQLRNRLLEALEEEETEEEREARREVIEAERERRREAVIGRQRIAEGEKELFSDWLTRKAQNIFSGKSSGLSWWTGSAGKLRPEMPVMSPRQVGSCTTDERDEICQELIKLWHSWAKESITKADALVLWIREALDTAAQMETELLRRGGRWITSEDDWALTRIRGSRRSPEPRLVFREHIEKEVAAWFKRVAWQYRASPGSPEGFDKAARASKVIGEPPPPWFDQPIRSLPYREREDLLDWISALTGALPQSTSARYGRASRRDVAECIQALCEMDGSLDAYRDDKSKGPAFVSRLWKHDKVSDLPVQVRGELGDLQRDARSAFSRATIGKVSDFDAWGAIRSRIRGKRKVKGSPEAALDIPRQRSQWYLRVIGQVIDKEAAKDPILALVAQCGDVPLRSYKELFRVQGDNIVHPRSYIVSFAKEHGVHSECLARRIARQLWEYRKANPRGEYVTKPAHMVNLIRVMQAMRVPCNREQQIQLESILGRPESPEGIYAQWMIAKEEDADLEEGIGEEAYREAGEGFSQAQARELLSGATFSGAGGYESNPRGLLLPSPVTLMIAAFA